MSRPSKFAQTKTAKAYKKEQAEISVFGGNGKINDVQLAQQEHDLLMNTIAERAAFYRANPHRFAADYLHLDLKLYQQIILYLMNYNTNFMFLASRG